MIYLCEKFCPEELKAMEVIEPPDSGSDFDDSEEEEEEEEEEEKEEEDDDDEHAGEVRYK